MSLKLALMINDDFTREARVGIALMLIRNGGVDLVKNSNLTNQEVK